MARRFDDSASQYLQVASAPVTGVPLSLSCRFNRAETELDGLVTVYDTGVTNHYHALTTSFTGAVVARSLDGGTPATATSSTTSVIGTWNHALAVFASATSRTIYLNGGGKVTDTTEILPNAFDATAIAGLGSGGGVYNYFNGSIAEVAIWKAALGDADALRLWAGYSPLLIRPRSLVAYWPLLQSTSWDRDFKGSFHLTPYNVPTWTAHPQAAQKYWLMHDYKRRIWPVMLPAVGGATQQMMHYARLRRA